MKDIEKIINNKNQLLIENYFELQSKSEELYGSNTLVFIEIGSFYEIYETNDCGKATDIAKILNIVLTKKNKSIKEISIKNPIMCGIPTVSLEKHLRKLSSENKWTILLISQRGIAPDIDRHLTKIISPGTDIDFNNENEDTYIASIFIEQNENNIFSAGLTLINSMLGSVSIYENFGKSNDKEIVLDELNQIISTYNVSEVILTYGDTFNTEHISRIINKNIPIIKREENNVKGSINVNYQEELFRQVFKTDSYLSPFEELDLERMSFGINSLSILLDFIIEHNKLLGVNLLHPKKIYSSKDMYLGNNPISQLSIYSKDSLDVMDIVNNGISSIGKRFIKEQLLNPIIDKAEIEDRYKKSKLYIGLGKKKEIESKLRNLYDLELLLRKIKIETIQPFEYANLYKSLVSIQAIKKIENIEDIELNTFIENQNNIFVFDYMETISKTNFDDNFIQDNYSKDIDNLRTELIEIEEKKDLFLTQFNKDFIVKESDQEGIYLELSLKRYDDNKETIKKLPFDRSKKLKGSYKLYYKELNDFSNQMFIIKEKLKKVARLIFADEINSMDSSFIKKNIEYISKLEFYINNSNLVEKKAYCIPEIKESENNFYESEDLRHPIVESIENEIYVPNDIQFGKKSLMTLDTNTLFQENSNVGGFLLYGQNSSGKTVLSKSIGISILLAQAGFFVPAKKMSYSIYKSLFTRISGNDNLLKGLSTFAVEMLELKNILIRANKNSLVIGDEISHGTETISGLSIVASTILTLLEKQSSFIIATHLHQLTDISDIRENENLSVVHLSLSYDEINDKLEYNRKISEGSGSSIYGLEFAKSLKLPQEFISKAYRIRREISNDLSGLEQLTKKQKSKYNSKVYYGACSECGKPVKDIHHIWEQKEANEKGLIGHFHKNNKANLKPLCEECHRKEHK